LSRSGEPEAAQLCARLPGGAASSWDTATVKDPALRRRLAESRVAPLVSLPTRVAAVARHNGHQLASSASWLVRSREHTNYTYDLEPLNLEHLAWFVADLAGRGVADARSAIDEVANDRELTVHLSRAVGESARRGLMDREIKLGRRVGWYALVRMLEPEHVVETGTDKGLGSCVLAAAVLRNGHGRVTTLDINPAAGAMIADPYADVIDLRIGDSLDALGGLDAVDLFLHDSDHSAGHEAHELAAITPRLTETALVLSDNAHVTWELPRWAEEHGRRFTFFAERPKSHWYPGGGIGVAAPRRPSGNEGD
jgi:predicted O-methyltransferase YrrM